ncbi:hypothetical protein POM88_046297 [Heracleum sosnowskyi]|uniref:Transposase-associated domain-containing protein n=1 Tax=Heracleum sosnowskyi TaxID=360622 RepID=A0AAD8H895_9APIA|nr:hypothetical protein POM88_046297 [Heracleum sosnowskyi]
MSSDRSWMSRRYDGRGGLSDEYKRGVDNFVEFAQRIKDTDGNILCPCTQCKNSAWRTEDELKVHLYRFGIIESYTRWEYHGEKSNWHDHYSMRTNQDDEDDVNVSENEEENATDNENEEETAANNENEEENAANNQNADSSTDEFGESDEDSS